MIMSQILGLKSLREIEQAQKSKQKRLYHLGVKSPVSRFALSRMNDERSADFFKDVFQQMLQSCKALAPGSQFKLPGVNSLILMDATTIQLCLNVFPWATYTQTKGALKLHFGLNDDGYLPDFMVATTGKVHEINVAKSLDYQPGSMIRMDRGYTDYNWWEELTRKGIYFVTRLKSNAVYDLDRRVETREYRLCTDIGWLEKSDCWKGLKAIGMVKSTVYKTKEQKETVDRRYYITSLQDVEEFAYSVRKHWSILFQRKI